MNKKLLSLEHKVAIVTGGAKGIGGAISSLFAEQGALVYVLDLDEHKGKKKTEEITNLGYIAHFRSCNVADQTDVLSVFKDIIDSAGHIDILVNNAGIAHIGNVETTTESDFDTVFSVNVKGVYNCMHAAVPYMKAQGGGVILNLNSVVSDVGIPDRFAYSASKGAVLTMTYSVAKDYLTHNIRCNAIAPGRVHTPFVDGYLKNTYPGKEAEMFEALSKTQPIGRMGKPKEIASLALFLCSEEAAFITGTNYPIDGGFIRLNT